MSEEETNPKNNPPIDPLPHSKHIDAHKPEAVGDASIKPSVIKPSAIKPGAHRKNSPTPSVIATIPSADASFNPHDYGRIDADGQVFVKNSAGEYRKIADWHAGDIESGLQHFADKYRAVNSEISLLQTRLHQGTNATNIAQSAQKIADELPHLTAIGDMEALAARLGALITSAEAKSAQQQLESAQLREKVVARKKEILTEAQALSGTENWKLASDKFKEFTAEWENLNSQNRGGDESLWRKFTKARDTFYRRRGAYFSEVDKRNGEIKRQKEELITKVAAIAARYDDVDKFSPEAWTKSASEIKEIFEQWKKFSRSSKAADDALWKRFKAANDQFYEAKKKFHSKKDQEREANAKELGGIISAQLKGVDKSQLDQVRAALQAVVKSIDNFPGLKPDKHHRVFEPVRELERIIRDKNNESRDNDTSEAQARAAQFQEKAERLKERTQKALKAGKTREAEELAAQAQQWEQWAQAAVNAIT